MSTVPPLEGWWLASNGMWYPPELHPAAALGPDPSVGADRPRSAGSPVVAGLPEAVALGTFRSRPVIVSGAVLAAVGAMVMVTGAALAAWLRHPEGLPVGLAVGLIGACLTFTGAGRLASRLEVGPQVVRWRWSFSRHEMSVRDLVDADLVEKGAPAPGEEWGSFVSGGFDAVIAWWILGLAASVFRASPSMGSRVLVLIAVHGRPVPVPAIGTWGTPASHSEAARALAAVRQAIRAGNVRVTGRPRSS